MRLEHFKSFCEIIRTMITNHDFCMLGSIWVLKHIMLAAFFQTHSPTNLLIVKHRTPADFPVPLVDKSDNFEAQSGRCFSSTTYQQIS